MAEYAVALARSARKDLEALPNEVVERVWTKIEPLANSPRPSGCKKLEGVGDLWRIRIGDYRVVYSVDDQRRMVDVIAVRHRKEAYR